MAETVKPVANNAGKFVTVACKLPHGLTLRIFEMENFDEPLMGAIGSRTTKLAKELQQRYVVNGFSHPQNRAPKHQIVEGFALTHRIPLEFWEKWLSQNKDSMMVKNNLIFAHEQAASTEDMATERKDVRSNLERLDPDKLPKGIQKSTGDVATV
jgi:hypothetical protein